MEIEKITPDFLTFAAKAKGYTIFEDDSKPFNLNLIGIRSPENNPNVFNDWFISMWKFRGLWNVLKFSCTTDPGLFYLGDRMLNPRGTAVVKPGQYKGMWKKGYHKGYTALQQKAPVTVLRDFNRDGLLNPEGGSEDTGIFGINGHRARQMSVSESVDGNSAGCIVHASDFDFQVTMEVVTQSIPNWGNSFTFTLYDQNDFRQILKF